MDHILAPHLPEALAHNQLIENQFYWDDELPSSSNETLVAGYASYQAFQRYLQGSDLYLLPRSTSELEAVLRRYAYDAIHNSISRARAELPRGGYSRMCHLAEASIRKVLEGNDNAAHLLSLHQDRPQHKFSSSSRRPTTYNVQSIRIK